MSFSRVNSVGWAVGDPLTSAQQNQLDIDHANALDKTAAGDTLLGNVTTSGAGRITAATAAGIVSSTAFGIQTTVAAGIVSGVAGGIQLAGGVLDWPTFQFARSRGVSYPIIPAFVPSGWTAGAAPGGASLQANASNNALAILLPVMHDGATLNAVSVLLSVTTPHSAVPASLPTIQCQRMQVGVSGNTLPITQDLSTVPVQSFGGTGTPPPPATGAAWVNSNKTQLLIYSCNQNNVISTASYAYVLYVTDENGANSQAGNFYLGITLQFTNIQDLRFS